MSGQEKRQQAICAIRDEMARYTPGSERTGVEDFVISVLRKNPDAMHATLGVMMDATRRMIQEGDGCSV